MVDIKPSIRLKHNKDKRFMEHPFSVSWHSRINIARPPLDTANQIVNFSKPAVLKHHGHSIATHAMVANHHYIGFRVKLIGALRYFTHGNQAGTCDAATLVFPVFPHIKQQGAWPRCVRKPHGKVYRLKLLHLKHKG
jgi:hypothetical protein